MSKFTSKNNESHDIKTTFKRHSKRKRHESFNNSKYYEEYNNKSLLYMPYKTHFGIQRDKGSLLKAKKAIMQLLEDQRFSSLPIRGKIVLTKSHLRPGAEVTIYFYAIKNNKLSKEDYEEKYYDFMIALYKKFTELEISHNRIPSNCAPIPIIDENGDLSTDISISYRIGNHGGYLGQDNSEKPVDVYNANGVMIAKGIKYNESLYTVADIMHNYFNLEDIIQNTYIRKLKKKIENDDKFNINDSELLNHMVSNDLHEVADFLIKNGADIFKKDILGVSAADHFLYFYSREEGLNNLNKIQKLVDLNIHPTKKNTDLLSKDFDIVACDYNDELGDIFLGVDKYTNIEEINQQWLIMFIDKLLFDKENLKINQKVNILQNSLSDYEKGILSSMIKTKNRLLDIVYNMGLDYKDKDIVSKTVNKLKITFVNNLKEDEKEEDIQDKLETVKIIPKQLIKNGNYSRKPSLDNNKGNKDNKNKKTDKNKLKSSPKPKISYSIDQYSTFKDLSKEVIKDYGKNIKVNDDIENPITVKNGTSFYYAFKKAVKWALNENKSKVENILEFVNDDVAKDDNESLIITKFKEMDENNISISELKKIANLVFEKGQKHDNNASISLE